MSPPLPANASPNRLNCALCIELTIPPSSPPLPPPHPHIQRVRSVFSRTTTKVCPFLSFNGLPPTVPPSRTLIISGSASIVLPETRVMSTLLSCCSLLSTQPLCVFCRHPAVCLFEICNCVSAAVSLRVPYYKVPTFTFPLSTTPPPLPSTPHVFQLPSTPPTFSFLAFPCSQTNPTLHPPPPPSPTSHSGDSCLHMITDPLPPHTSSRAVLPTTIPNLPCCSNPSVHNWASGE